MYKSYRMLKLPDIHRFYVALYMYRVIEQRECPTVEACLDLIYPSHEYNTRNSGNIVPPFPRVESMRSNFEFQFVAIWNSVPEYIKKSPNIRKFKSAFRDFILGSY